ncbi:MAG: hypothetical protein DI635_15155 [Pseudoxanthomonas suwonensis]|nr:MAG: hypothetical protein DI635_15155 [Pseudoxanthomonas suwonensis]
MIGGWLTPRLLLTATAGIWGMLVLLIVLTITVHAVRVTRARRREELDAVARPLVASLVLADSEAGTGGGNATGENRDIATHQALLQARGALGDRVDERLMALLDVVRGEGRERLVAMLVRRGHPQRLRRRAGSHRSATRAGAVRRLGLLGLPVDAPLIREATSDRSAIVRSVAARALAAYPEPLSVHAILSLVREDRAIPALVLMNALVHIGQQEGDCLAVIRAGLDDPAPRVRAACARVLGELTSAVDGDHLAHLVDHDPAPSVRLAAATALTRVGTAAHVPSLLGAASSVWAPVRVECVRALQSLPPAVSADALAEIASHQDPVLAAVLAPTSSRTEP